MEASHHTFFIRSWRILYFLPLCLIACDTDDVDAQSPSVVPSVIDAHQQVFPVLNKRELKVLDIGNSYTNDATSLLPQIVEASGVDYERWAGAERDGSLDEMLNIFKNKLTECCHWILYYSQLLG